MLTYGSLFTGIGGFDLGFDRAGMKGIWQVERDKDCNRILEKHWHGTKRFDDVTTFDPATAGRPDVICGGFPCQDLSVAGKRAGLAGGRSGLWHEFRRIIGCALPRIVVIENVPGLLSSNGGGDFLVIIRGLADLGYCCAWTVLDSQYFGVAQRRERVFIVGSLGDGRCAEILFEPESVRGDSPPSRKKRQDVAGSPGSNSEGGFRTTDLDGTGAFIPVTARCLNAGRDGYNDGSDQTYIPEVTGCLGAHSKAHGHAMSTGQAAASGQILVTASLTSFGEYVEDETASTCKERDYKDATDLVVHAAFDERQITCPTNRLSARPDRTSALNEGAGISVAVAPINDMATRHAGTDGSGHQVGKGHGLGIGKEGDPMFTLSGGDRHAVAFTADGETADPISASEGKTYTHEGNTMRMHNCVEAIPILEAGARTGKSTDDKRCGSGIGEADDPMFTLQSGKQHAVGIAENQRGELIESEQSHQLTTGGGKPGQGYPAARIGTMVRRLTPQECERLQGFPDDWTRWDATSKEVSDSARYRMLGNAVTVSVAEWIGRRIVEICR